MQNVPQPTPPTSRRRADMPAPSRAVRQTGETPPANASGGFLGSLKIWQKLLLITLMFTIPLVGVASVLVIRQNDDIAKATQEGYGAAYITALGGVLERTPQHRGLTNAFLNGNVGVKERRDQVGAALQLNLAAIAELDARYGTMLESTTDFRVLRRDLETLIEVADTLTPSESFAEHTRIINEQVIPLLSKIADTSTLTLAPNLETYYTTLIVTQQLPKLTENLGQMRGYGAGVLARGSATQEDRLFIAAQANLIRLQAREVEQAVDAVATSDPSLAAAFRPLLEQATPLVVAVTLLAEQSMVLPETISADSTQYFDEVTRAIDAYFAFYNVGLERLNAAATDFLASTQQIRLITLAVIALVVMLTFVLVFVIARQISVPIGQLFHASERLSKGDLTVRVPVVSRDEIGALTRAFNTSTKQLREASARQELELAQGRTMQESIGRFLNVAMDIASGDLTRRGEVSADVLGNVIDAINVVVEEIGLLLGQVQDAAGAVTAGAGQMAHTSDSIVTQSETQTSQAQAVAHETHILAETIRTMADNANAAAQAAADTRLASEQGQEAVTVTLEQMQTICHDVKAAAEQVRELGRRSRDISDVVDSVTHIASQINLLALSAALEAAGAGEAGARFATVADEVRRLAEDSAEATLHITTMIDSLQADVQRTVTAVQASSHEVESGYRVASQAGARLREIGSFAGRSAQLAEAISHASQDQVARAAQVGAVLAQVVGVADASQSSALEGRAAAQQLTALAERLSANLARFRLA